MRKKRPLPVIVDDPSAEDIPGLQRRQSNFFELPRFEGPSANARKDTTAYSPSFPSPIEEHKDEHKEEDKGSSHYSNTTGDGRESSSTQP